MDDLLAFFQGRLPDMVGLLRQMVLLESPTSSKEHVDRLGTFVGDVCRDLGANVAVYPRQGVGDLHMATWNDGAPGRPIMLVTHLDTVWPVGTLEKMPLREEGDLLYGPGALDMKGGVVIALEAIRGLRDRGELPNRPIWIFFNSDEETGSFHSRDLLMEKARQVGLVLVMEPASDQEAFKVWRKGIARYKVTTQGRAAHAGQAPETGINAVIEAAHQALAVHGLNDLPNGTSVSVTVMHGGFATNVIPAEATFDVDVRFLKASEAGRVDRAIKALTPVLPGATVSVEGEIDRGPMERDEQMSRVVAQAQAIARSLGMEVGEAGSGGASDGNFTAAMGIPTLDGLGAGGIGLHAAHEQVQIPSLARRAALVAKLLCDWDMSAV